MQKFSRRSQGVIRSRRIRSQRRAPYRPLMRRKKTGIVIPRAIRNQQIHKFRRYADNTTTLSPDNAANSLVFTELAFSFADIQSQAEFTALYDQYRITAVKIEITPFGQFISNDRTVTGAGGVAPANDESGTGYWRPPILYSVIDYNDDNSLGSISAAQEYSTCKIIPYGKKYSKWYFTPCVNFEVAESSTTTAKAATKYAPWLATSSTNVPHYGMKFIVLNPNENNVGSAYATASWTVRVCYYFECKNVS